MTPLETYDWECTWNENKWLGRLVGCPLEALTPRSVLHTLTREAEHWRCACGCLFDWDGQHTTVLRAGRGA